MSEVQAKANVTYSISSALKQYFFMYMYVPEIHASMLCKSTRNTLSQKSREAKRDSSENNRKQVKGKNKMKGKNIDKNKQKRKVALRGTQREYSSKPLKYSILERLLVFKR